MSTTVQAVSYTHLDVYKRQFAQCAQKTSVASQQVNRAVLYKRPAGQNLLKLPEYGLESDTNKSRKLKQ